MQDLTLTHPIGSSATTRVHAIGGRSELVTGTVADYRYSRRSGKACALVVQTEFHGRLVVSPAELSGD